jgi:hypothetical protein
MAFTEGFSSLAGSAGTSSLANSVLTFVVATMFILILGGGLLILILVLRGGRYNTIATVFVPTHAGFKIFKYKSGLIPNKKTGKPEFTLKKPKVVINNYNSEYILPSGKRGFFSKDQCFLVLTKINKYEMLNPMLVREDGNTVAFVAKNVGKDRLSELMDTQVEELFTVESFLNKYGMQIFFGSVMFVQILMVILLIQYGNKILGA